MRSVNDISINETAEMITVKVINMVEENFHCIEPLSERAYFKFYREIRKVVKDEIKN